MIIGDTHDDTANFTDAVISNETLMTTMNQTPVMMLIRLFLNHLIMTPFERAKRPLSCFQIGEQNGQ